MDIMPNRDFLFTDNDFNNIRSLVKHHTGISLSDAKKNMVYSRLSRRLRSLQIQTFKEYCALIESGDSQELVQFTNSITTNLTAFFRENHHFEFLKNTAIPEVIARNTSTRKINIWCCASSTGEEPYSIAMSVLESIPQNQTWDIKITATDLDSSVLEIAKRGVYTEDRISGIDKKRIKRWFWRGKGNQEGMAMVNPELKNIISFKQTNLLEKWPSEGPFDIVFCRNVVIYFDKPTQKILFERIANAMYDDSYLLIGHSESLFKVSNRFKLIGQTIYKKI